MQFLAYFNVWWINCSSCCIVFETYSVGTYRFRLQYGGIAAVLFGMWMEGGIANEAKWEFES
jgi:hypothetical protein